MAKKSHKPDPQQRGADSSETQIDVRLGRRDTVIFDIKTPSVATSSFSMDYSAAQRLGLQLVELVASARQSDSDRLFEEKPPGTPMIHRELEFAVAKDGRSVRFIIHAEDWKPLILTLDAAEVDELVEKVLDVRRELVMQNE
jgi:hypothetical protein